MWLLINNIYEKIWRWLSRRNSRVSRNQGKIAPSRACAWFENKRFDWPSVSFSDHWPIRMLGLFPFFCTVLNKNALLLTNQNKEIFSCILLGALKFFKAFATGQEIFVFYLVTSQNIVFVVDLVLTLPSEWHSLSKKPASNHCQ